MTLIVEIFSGLCCVSLHAAEKQTHNTIRLMPETSIKAEISVTSTKVSIWICDYIYVKYDT